MRKYWIGLIAVLVIGFMVLGWAGWRIYQEKPPIPTTVATTDGRDYHHRSRHRGGTECVAGDGRDGARVRLGTR